MNGLLERCKCLLHIGIPYDRTRSTADPAVHRFLCAHVLTGRKFESCVEDSRRTSRTNQKPQGTHGDENLGEVDALLPGATFVEKEGIYVNTEGRPQRCTTCARVRVCIFSIDCTHLPEQWSNANSLSGYKIDLCFVAGGP